MDIKEIKKLKVGEVLTNVNIKKYTTYHAGGIATCLVIPKDVDKLIVLLKYLKENNIKHKILGNGSNLIFSDSLYDGVLIKLDKLDKLEITGNKIVVGAGYNLIKLAIKTANLSLTGLEFASGIPGTIGGAVFMNAGAYGGEMKDIVASVHAVSPDGKEERDFTGEEMNFGYRRSILQDNGWIATDVTFNLTSGNVEEISAKMKDLNARRNAKQPVNYPSAGSTFKRPEGYFAGKLIEDAGLKGLTVGGAQVSTLHSGFIINKGGATATDILQLIALVQNTVYDKFGVMLEPEVRIIG